MVAGQKYNTARGPATWDGKVFTADNSAPSVAPTEVTAPAADDSWAASRAKDQANAARRAEFQKNEQLIQSLTQQIAQAQNQGQPMLIVGYQKQLAAVKARQDWLSQTTPTGPPPPPVSTSWW
jgi:hypothetical protein